MMMMMRDIVERLRTHKEARLSIASGLHEHDTPSVCRDAADEIVQLRAELIKHDGDVQTLREALEWFCQRVEKGEVRSTQTYQRFKELLSTT
jgi:hypothetical protein